MITLHSYSENGVYTGTGEYDEYAPVPALSTTIAPPKIPSGKVAIFDGAKWSIGNPPAVVPPAIPVPASITMRQARLQLHAIGKLSAVQEAINQLPEPPRTSAQIEWDYAAVVERASPFVALLTPALGLSDEEMDELFIQAVKL